MWERALDCPGIWRNADINLESDIVLHDSSSVKETTVKYGRHMKR